MDKVSEKLGSQKQTLEQLTAELAEMREKADASRKEREDEISLMKRQREIERQKLLEDSRRRERGYQRMHEESVRRALERREMLSGIDNSSKFQKGKGIQGESLARMK